MRPGLCLAQRTHPPFTMSKSIPQTDRSRSLETCHLIRPCCAKAGGASRDRTDDPLLAKQVLSQLSYGPEDMRWWAWVDSNYRPHAYQACALTN